jgi:hypothetical protein
MPADDDVLPDDCAVQVDLDVARVGQQLKPYQSGTEFSHARRTGSSATRAAVAIASGEMP